MVHSTIAYEGKQNNSLGKWKFKFCLKYGSGIEHDAYDKVLSFVTTSLVLNFFIQKTS